jgi:hypothetical protein
MSAHPFEHQLFLTSTPRLSRAEITSARAGVRNNDNFLSFVRDNKGDMSTNGMSTNERLLSDERVANSGALVIGISLRFSSVNFTLPDKKRRESTCTEPRVNVVSCLSSPRALTSLTWDSDVVIIPLAVTLVSLMSVRRGDRSIIGGPQIHITVRFDKLLTALMSTGTWEIMVNFFT